MAAHKEYRLALTINERHLNRVLISQHYREKHKDIDDDLILELVKTLDGQIFAIEDRKKSEGKIYEFMNVEPVMFDDKPHRIVLVLCLSDDYLGVVNAFRVRRKK